MKKSFYHYMMKHRASLIKNEISDLAEAMYDDLSFPKQSEDYDEISSYLELSGLLGSMSIFDEAWELYIQER
ncbi:YozE family protein [Bacillus sp. NPDC094106]|uniref:YozE family protein n=1 Tax=Bacillus sp. NPDC094106 TaxID=3363949 RepID=UPI0037F3FB8E